MLSTGHLHARYFGLLLAPLQLSCDWSYACVPLVEQLGDPRNLLTMGLYAYLAFTLLAAQPWRLLREWFSGQGGWLGGWSCLWVGG